MRYYDFEKAKKIIEESKKKVVSACFGMEGDWGWTCETIYEDDNFKVIPSDDNKVTIAGITGSTWATPCLELTYEDGTEETIECFYGEKEAEKPSWIQEVLMRIFSTREMIRGLDISTTTLYNWKDEEKGMPVIRQNPYLFNVESLEWIIKNKPEYADKAKKMLEG